MESFTIRDVENLTGIKAHTLRIWEQRYQLFTPKRKESLHRFYDNEDLKNLLRISFLYHSGWKVSKIAALGPAQILREVENAAVSKTSAEQFINLLLEAAIDFNEARFIQVLLDIKEKIGFEKCVLEVCYPYLRKLGLLWSTNNVIPAQEHFSSYIIQNQIIVETEKLELSAKKPEIILICPQGEYHELPLLFINYLLRKNKWSTIYMGSNISSQELTHLASLPGIRYIYLHLITNFTGMYTDDYLEGISRNFSDKQIIASGEGLGRVERKFTNLTLLQSDGEIYRFIERSGI